MHEKYVLINSGYKFGILYVLIEYYRVLQVSLNNVTNILHFLFI